MSYFNNKTILITGAASGIGKELATRLSAMGGELLLLDRDESGLEATKVLCQGKVPKLLVCDLSKMSSIEDLCVKVKQLSIDILINNAGVVSGKRLTDLSSNDIHRTFMVNTIAAILLSKAVLDGMRASNSGQIINICSASSFVGVPKLSDYAASKAALASFDESLRLELRDLKSQVSTTAFCPFYINTGMFEGVKTRFSWLLPILDPHWIVNRLIRAIERKERRVVTPWFVYSTFLIKVFPSNLSDFLLRFFGVNSSMDDFKGRQK